MDQTDKLLLEALRQNARMSLSALARVVGVSRSTAQDRLTKLEERGVIAGYTLRLGEDFSGREVRAQVMLKILPRAQDEVVAFCRRHAGITRLYTVSGEYDLIAHLRAESTAAIDDVLDELGRLKGVERTQTSVILSTKFERAD